MGKQRARRKFSADFKRQVVSETYAAGTSVSVIARRHDINANLLFRWRDDPRYAQPGESFLPVEIVGTQEVLARDDDPGLPSEIGIWIASDIRIVVKGGFEPEALGRLIRSIRMAS
jgi:transposase